MLSPEKLLHLPCKLNAGRDAMLVLTQCRHARRLRGLQQICGGRVGHGLKAQDVMGGQAVSPQQNIGLVRREAQARLVERATFQTEASTEIIEMLVSAVAIGIEPGSNAIDML